MPQADLFYTADQSIDAAALLAKLEAAIAAFDPLAGTTKGRGHAVTDYHHGHILLSLSMLAKPHRDAAYASALGAKLAEVIRPHATAPTGINVHIRFDLVHYTSLAVD